MCTIKSPVCNIVGIYGAQNVFYDIKEKKLEGREEAKEGGRNEGR